MSQSPSPSMTNEHQTDVIVVGAGVAGLSSALEAAEAGASVLVLSKSELMVSNTAWAQGGIAAATEDTSAERESHFRDTIDAGDGLCDEATVRMVTDQGAETIRFLQSHGARFDQSESGDLALGREAAHSSSRIVHAGGDATGAEVARSLLDACHRHTNVTLQCNVFVRDLLLRDGRVCGVEWLDQQARAVRARARAVVLASGGVGKLYRESSNSPISTGDGHAMASRAGAVLRDMELVQFHPTLLYVTGAPRVLVTEAIRGAGGLLRTSSGERFMKRFDERLELAPRDVVSRAVSQVLRETGDTAVFLDVTGIGAEEVARRFPRFFALCEHYGIDIRRSWVPIRPGPHYMIGGVKVDLDGRSSLPGLFATGEACSSGLHGANRLASNSLLEGVVLGRRAGIAASAMNLIGGDAAPPASANESARTVTDLDFEDLRATFRSLMFRYMGVERDGRELHELVRRCRHWDGLMQRAVLPGAREWEFVNMLHAGVAMAESALLREESRGVHFRRDFPQRRDDWSQQHIEYRRGEGARWQQREV